MAITLISKKFLAMLLSFGVSLLNLLPRSLKYSFFDNVYEITWLILHINCLINS